MTRYPMIPVWVLALAVGACTGNSTDDPADDQTGTVSYDVVPSAAARELAPSVLPSDLQTLVEGNSAFAFDLYAQIRHSPGNLFFSPYSISLALTMLQAGARGDTETQMAAALHHALASADLHPAFNALDLALESRAEPPAGTDGDGFDLEIANSVWGQTDFPFLTAYADTLALNYGAPMRLLDFNASPDPSRITINAWVSDNTHGRIDDLLPPGSVNTDTRLVLANAIYFKAAWASPFEPSATAPGTFDLLGGGETTADMMSETATFGTAATSGCVAVELPYDGDELSMVVVVPDAGTFAAFESTLDASVVEGIVSSLQPTHVCLKLPRFSYSSEFALRTALVALGMTDAFDAVLADFSGISSQGGLYVSDAYHKAFVSVDEEGTEAAAATGVVVGVTSMPPELTVDRPFLYFIRDIATGAILFVGRVVDPAA